MQSKQVEDKRFLTAAEKAMGVKVQPSTPQPKNKKRDTVSKLSKMSDDAFNDFLFG